MRSCYIQRKDSGIEVKAPNGASSFLFEKAKYLVEEDTALASRLPGENVDEKALELWKRAVSAEDMPLDTNGEPDYTINILPKEVSNRAISNLFALMNRMGVKFKTMVEYNKEHEARTGEPLSANVKAVADTVNKIIAFTKGDIDSLIEEAVHMMSATMRGDSTFERLIRLVDTTPEFAEYYDHYFAIYKDDKLARKEVLDKIIMSHIKNPAYSLPSRILMSLKRLINKIIPIFKNVEVEHFAQELRRQIEDNAFKNTEIQEDQLQFNVDMGNVDYDLGFSIQTLLQDIDDMKITLSRQGNEGGAAKMERMQENIGKRMKIGGTKQATLYFLKDLEKNIRYANEHLVAIKKNKIENIHEAARTMKRLHENIIAFKTTIDVMRKTLTDLDDQTKLKLLELVNDFSVYEKEYEEATLKTSNKLSSPWVEENPLLTPKEYAESLKQTKDISMWSKALQALGNIKDDAVKIFDQIYKKARGLVFDATRKDYEDLLKLRNAVENFDDLRFIQKDENGNITHYMINKEGINFDKYMKARAEMFNEIRKKYDVPSGKVAFVQWKIKNPLQYKEWKKDRDAWLRKNQEAIPNLHEFMLSKLKSRATSILARKNPKLVDAIYQSFRQTNYQKDKKTIERIKLTYGDMDERTEEEMEMLVDALSIFVLKNSHKDESKKVFFTNDLATPKVSLYKDDSYEKLTDAEKAYLDKGMEIKKNIYRLPVSHESLYLLPQIRKSTAERLQQMDIKALVRNGIDAFKITEDDDQYGQLGTEMRLIPVHFVEKVPIEELSTDTTSLFTSFSYMSNHYIEMHKIQDQMLIMEEVLNRRKILNSKGQDTGRVGGLLAERASTYLDVNMFGKARVDEKVFGRIVDTLNGFTSFMGLNFNVFSGVANILHTHAQLIQERFAGTISKQHWKKADNFYNKNLADSIRAYDDPNRPSRMTAISRLFDIKDDFRYSVGKSQPGVSKWLKRATSSPYLPNHIGEHYGNHRVGFATISDTKAFRNGEEVNLLDVIEDDGFSAWVPDDVVDENGKKINITEVALQINKRNQRLFGIYNTVDSNELQRYAMGRALMVFRKFIVAPFNRRYNAKEYDYQMKEVTEGMYRTFGRLMYEGWTEAAEGKSKLIGALGALRWSKLSKEDKLNVHKTYIELGMALGAYISYLLLAAALEGEEDENLALSFVAYQLRRHLSELTFFINPLETQKILRSPAATVSTIDWILKLPNIIDPTGDYFLRWYQDGTDESYLQRTIMRRVPIINNIAKIPRTDEIMQNYHNF